MKQLILAALTVFTLGSNAHALDFVMGTSGADNLACPKRLGGANCLIMGYNPYQPGLHKDVGDTLKGAVDGIDYFVGGEGGDTLTGGTGGYNAFLYNGVSDSTVGDPDVITNFNTTTDMVDFAAPCLHFGLRCKYIGDDKFDGTPGEVRFRHGKNASGNEVTFVEADFNGSKKAQMEIDLQGDIDLQSQNISFAFIHIE